MSKDGEQLCKSIVKTFYVFSYCIYETSGDALITTKTEVKTANYIYLFPPVVVFICEMC